ncbi:hypothetical protein SCOR_32525 [Sulfidibacter corallicola]
MARKPYGTGVLGNQWLLWELALRRDEILCVGVSLYVFPTANYRGATSRVRYTGDVFR